MNFNFAHRAILRQTLKDCWNVLSTVHLVTKMRHPEEYLLMNTHPSYHKSQSFSQSFRRIVLVLTVLWRFQKVGGYHFYRFFFFAVNFGCFRWWVLWLQQTWLSSRSSAEPRAWSLWRFLQANGGPSGSPTTLSHVRYSLVFDQLLGSHTGENLLGSSVYLVPSVCSDGSCHSFWYIFHHFDSWFLKGVNSRSRNMHFQKVIYTCIDYIYDMFTYFVLDFL